jgi:renal tumor antigen
MDIWAFACVFYELMALTPLFPGKDELDQINRIHAILGTPAREVLASFRRHANGHLRDIQFPAIQGCGFARKLTHCSPELVELLNWMLTYNPEERPSSRQLLKHQYFQSRLPSGSSQSSGQQSAGTLAADDNVSTISSSRSSSVLAKTITNFDQASSGSTHQAAPMLPPFQSMGGGTSSHILLNATVRGAGGGFLSNVLPPIASSKVGAKSFAPKYKNNNINKQPAFVANNPLFSQTGLNFLRPLR